MAEQKEGQQPKKTETKPAKKAGKEEGASKSPRISPEEAKEAIQKAEVVAQRLQRQEVKKTLQETLKIAQEAVQAVKAQPEAVSQLEFLKGAPILSEEAFAPVILELVAEVNRRKIETDPDFLVGKAAKLKEIARKTGADWIEALGFINAFNAKAKEIANKQAWIGERMYGLQKTIDEIEQPPKPLPSKSLLEPELEQRLPTLSVLPEKSRQRLLSFNARFKVAPQNITREDFSHFKKYLDEAIIDMKQKEGESVADWQDRHERAYGEVERYLEAISPKIAEFLGPPLGTRERFNYKIRSHQFAKEFRKPENHKLRDDEFYAILSEIISSREASARDLYGLYERAEISDFMIAVGSMPGVGRELARHYRLLQRAIMQCHDIDYYAGNPHGDVKSFVTSASLFRNEYWVEAHKNPLIEIGMRCYYQALMMLRDNNNGFIPAWLVEGGYLDQLAEDLFIQRINMKQVYDVVRKEDGMPVLNKYQKPVLNEKKTLEFKDVWDDEKKGLNNRAKAVLQMAKGCNIVQLHFLEIIAYSRVPGYDYPTAAAFASKPYEGLARWINWTGDLAGKYSWGESLHLPFFNILAKRGKKTKWTQSEARRVIEAAAEGRLEEVFGEDAQRLIDVVDMGRVCGWGGPGSKWRMLDTTHYWDDKQKETLGAGIWLTYAGDWAKGEVRKKVVDEKYRREFRKQLCQTAKFPEEEKGWTDKDRQNFEMLWLESGMRKKVYGGKIEREWEDLQRKSKKKGKITYIDENGEKQTINIKKEEKRLEQIYKTKAVIHMVMRNPIRAASIVELKRTRIEGVPDEKITLRDKIIEQVLGIPLAELSGSYITTPGTPTKEMMEKQNQVAEVEGAIAALHEKTINYVLDEKGDLVPGMEPRDLRIDDFDAIPEHGEKVRDLRQKAKDYWKMVQKEILGKKWSAEDWEKELFANPKNRFKTVMVGGKKEERYVFKKGLDIEKVLKKGAASNLRKLLKKEWVYLFAPEDISWGALDVAALGGRHPLRKAGDFGAYIEGVTGLGLFIDQLAGEPDFGELLKQLKAAKAGFKGYDPYVGYKACYRFADAMFKIYDRAPWAQPLLIGTYLKALKPSSIAKEVYGITNAIDLGPGEKKEIIDLIGNMNILPPQEEIYGKHFEYNIEKLAAENGAQTINLIIELIMRGSVMAAGAIVFAALTAKEEEE